MEEKNVYDMKYDGLQQKTTEHNTIQQNTTHHDFSDVFMLNGKRILLFHQYVESTNPNVEL